MRSRLESFSDFVLAGCSLYCFGVGLYFFYHYSWVQDRSFSSGAGMIWYYIFPALLAALLGAALKLPGAIKVNLSLLLLTTALCLHGAEICLEIRNTWAQLPAESEYTAINKRNTEAKKYNTSFDIRPRHEVIEELRKQGIDAYPSTGAKIALEIAPSDTRREGTELLPLGGISRKTTVLCNESGEYVAYPSDEHGFHNPIGMWENHDLQIAAVGDSFTNGYCVPSDKNFVALIRNRYPRTLNLGIDGDGPLFELATLKEYLPPFHPRVVLWFYYEGNDLNDLRQEQSNPLLMRYLTRAFHQDLINRQAGIDHAIAIHLKQWMTEWMEPSRLELFKEAVSHLVNPTTLPHTIDEIVRLGELRGRLGMLYGVGVTEKEDPISDDRLKLFNEALREAKKSVNAWGGELVFVYLPEWARYAQPQLANQHQNQILLLLKNLEIPAIDIDHAFRRDGDPLDFFPFRINGHYNKKGHQIVAREVLRYLVHDKS